MRKTLTYGFLLVVLLLSACSGRSNPLGGTALQQLEQAEEGVVEVLWLEIGDYWPSESSYTNFPACYYGAHISLLPPESMLDEENREENLDDEGTTRQEFFTKDVTDEESNWDSRGSSWLVFEVADYDVLVRHGIVEAIDLSGMNANEQQTAIGQYLCGASPQNGQYGALGEPEVSFVKLEGELYDEDPENALIDSDRYGYWCYQADDGSYVELDDEEAAPAGKEVERCLYQKPGGSTAYYWYYRSNYWYRGPRRCYYCSGTDWTGDSVVTNRRVAEVNQTANSTITRGPSGLGSGGTGSGSGSGK